MDNTFEKLNEIYEDENIPTLLDMVECSTIVIVPDVREFTHDDAIRIAQRFDYDDEIDFEEDYVNESEDILKSPLDGKTTEKFIVSEAEVKYVINRIATSGINLITNEKTDNARNNLFMQKHDLTKEDITYLVKQLKIGDYSYSSNSKNINFPNSILTFFITNKDFILPDGRKFEILKVYVKVDVADEGLVTSVSFHDGTSSEIYPYQDNQ